MKEKMNEFKKIIFKYRKWIIVVFLLLIFAAITDDVFEKEVMRIDPLMYDLLIKNIRCEWLTEIMKVITQMGGFYVLPIICISVLIFAKNKEIGLLMTTNLVFIALLNIILKMIVQRPRPTYMLVPENGYSFPSGHAMTSTAFYGLIIYLIYKNVKNVKLRNISVVIVTMLIFLISFSRIYLGVHYTSDVIAGTIFSIAYLICIINLYEKKF